MDLVDNLFYVVDRSTVVLLGYAFREHASGRKMIKKDIKNGNEGITLLKLNKKMKTAHIKAFEHMINQLLGFCNVMRDSPHLVGFEYMITRCNLTISQMKQYLRK